ncbi:uncharacterized protein TM35_000521240 [Trypanosoma theileri]|uniref:Uncharacterized protein n=1 Tax=Trypanosoma theileri TaxID=67003 RepID=A0A1X0NIP7_9TRYP|nr:uncharacterized protein TM35_000521240 [Trypanosoma theileri]ORC83980.1 hypothetical protein TM35_000521240 [Trypanosoma theileri]
MGILVCWDPTACPTTTMCEACLAFPWEMEARKPGAAIRQPSLPRASRDSLQRVAAPTPRWWQKKVEEGTAPRVPAPSLIAVLTRPVAAFNFTNRTGYGAFGQVWSYPKCPQKNILCSRGGLRGALPSPTPQG